MAKICALLHPRGVEGMFEDAEKAGVVVVRPAKSLLTEVLKRLRPVGGDVASKEYASPTSATSGLAPYSLEGQAKESRPKRVRLRGRKRGEAKRID